MLGKRSFINTFFMNDYGISDDEKTIKGEKLKAYDKVKATLDKTVSENVESIVKEVKSFTLSSNDMISPRYNVNKMLHEEKKIADIIKNNGSIIAIDTETLGDFKADPVNFVMTEFASNEIKFVNGKMQKVPKDRFAFGIPGKVSPYYQSIINKAKHNHNLLTDTEKWMLERLSMYAGKFEKVFEPVIGKNNTIMYYKLRELNSPNKYSAERAISGFENLLKLGHLGQAYSQTNSTKNALTKTLFSSIRNTIKNADVIMGYNNEAFDNHVITHTMAVAGYHDVKIKNSYDFFAHQQAAYGDNILGLHNALADANGIDKSNIPRIGLGKLENFQKSVGYVSGLSHEAGNDIDWTVDLAFNKYLGDKSIHEDMLERFQHMKANNGAIPFTNADAKNKVFYTNKAIPLGPLDFVRDRDGKVKPSYITYGINNGHYYKFDNYYTIDAKDIHKNKELQKALESAGHKVDGPLHILSLKEAAQNTINEHQTFLIRQSKEELELAIQQNLEVLELVKTNVSNSSTKSITQKAININTSMKVKDNARRAFQSGFEISSDATNGFSFLNNMYGAYNELNDIVKEHLGNDGKISKSKLRTLLTNGSVEITNGVTINVDVLEKKGLSSYERKEKFYELYDILGDTNNTIGSAINDIKETINEHTALFSLDEKTLNAKAKYVNVKRTIAIRDYFERLKGAIKDYKLSSFEKRRTAVIRKQATIEMLNAIENDRQKKAAYLFKTYNDNIQTIFKNSTHLQSLKVPTFEEILEQRLNGVFSNEYLATSTNKVEINKRINDLRRMGMTNTPEYKALVNRYAQIKDGAIVGSSIDKFLNEFQTTLNDLPNQFQTEPQKKKFMDIATGKVNRMDKFNLEKATASIDREVNNMVLKKITPADLSYIKFDYKENVVKINAASKTTAIQSLYSAVNNITGPIHKELVKKQEQQKVLSGMIDTLFENNIFTKEDEAKMLKGLGYKAFKDIKDSRVLATFISSSLFNIANEAKLNISEETLKDPTARIEELEEYRLKKELLRNGEIDPGSFRRDKELDVLDKYRRVQTTEPIYEFNGKGYKVGNSNIDSIVETESFKKHVAKKGHDLNAITNISDISFYGAHELKNNKNKFDKNTVDIFKKFGYDEHQISHLERHLFDGTHGLAGNHGLTTAIYSINEDGVEKLFMSLSTIDNTGHMVNAITKNQLPTKAANLEFDRIWRWPNELKTVQTGSVHKIITRETSVYAEGGKATVDIPKYQRLKTEIIDTIERGFDNVFIQSNMMATLIKAGEFEEATKLGSRKLKEPIHNGLGAVGTFTLNSKDGSIKSFLPAPSDYESAKLIKTESLVNYVPFLYEHDEEFKKFVDESMKPYGAKDAAEFIDKWKNEIEDYHFKGFSGKYKLELTQQHEFITNLLQGQKFIEKLSRYTHLLQNEHSGEAIIRLIEMSLNQVVKEHNGIELGYVREGNSLDNIALSKSTDSSRPTMLQKLNAHPIIVTDHMINDDKKHELLDRDISIGADITTRRWQNNIATNNIPEETLELMDKRLSDLVKNEHIERELTGNMAVLSTKDVAKRLNEIDIDEILKTTGRSLSEKHYVEEALEKYKVIAPTFEQHALINPYMYFEFFDSHDLMAHSIGKNFKFEEGLSTHSEVQSGQIIGSYTDKDGKTVSVRNTSKEIAHIEGMADGKLYLSPETPIINDIKVNYGGAEKSVASIASHKKQFRDIYQAIWDSAFGKNISLIANPEMAKHETGTLIFGSPLFKIANKVKQANNKELTNEFIKVANSAFGAEAIGLSYIDGIKKIVSTHAIGEGIGFDTATTSIIDHFKNISSYKDMFKDILDDTKADPISGILNYLIKRVTISKTIMSESHSASSGLEDELGKGVQIDDRLLQTTDLIFSEDEGIMKNIYKYDESSKKFVHNLEPIKEQIRSLAKEANLHDVTMAIEDVGNIIHATRKLIDDNYENTLIKSIHFDEINMLPKGGLSASDLEKTIFDKTVIGNSNLIKIQLPDGIKVTNPLTKESADHLIFPVLNTHAVKDEVFLSSTHKSMADILRRVNDVENGNSNKSLQDSIKDISASYHKLVKSYEFDLADKEGLLYRHILKNRVPFSGQLLAQTVVPLEEKGLDESGKMVYDFVEGIGIKDAIVRKDGKVFYNDIVEVSEKALTNMGIEFDIIGKDLHKNKFELINNDRMMEDLIKNGVYNNKRQLIGQNNLNFLEYIKDNTPKSDNVDDFLKSGNYSKIRNGFGGAFSEFFKTDNEFVDLLKSGNTKHFAEKEINNRFGYAFSEIGRTFMQHEGIKEKLIRYPTFSGTSNFIANIRLNRYMEGMTARVAGYTAKKLNLDIDADRLSNILLGLVQRKDNRSSMLVDHPNSEAQRELQKTYNAQALLNGEKGVGVGMDKSWVQKTVEANMDAQKHTGDFTANMEAYIKQVREAHIDDSELFNFRYDTARMENIGVHARMGKGTIGLISNPSFYLRNAAQSVLLNGENKFKNLQKLGKIVSFTSLVEQKPIDSKHIKDFSKGIPAVNFGKAMELMASGKPGSLDEGEALLKDTIKVMNLSKNKPEVQAQLDEAVVLIKDVFSNKTARDIYNFDIMGAKRHPDGYKIFNDKSKMIKDNTFELLENMALNPSKLVQSDLTRGHIALFKDFIQSTNDDLIIHNKLVTPDSTMFLNEKNGLGIEAGAYKVKTIHDDSNKVTMVQLDKGLKETGNSVDILGRDMIDISTKMNMNFDNTNKIADTFYQDSLKDYDTFIRSKAIAEHAAGNGTIENANAIINKYNINDMTSDELFKHTNSMNDIRRQEIANAFNIHYNTESGKSVERFTKEVQYMKGKYYSNELGGKLIQQFNEGIKKSGATYDSTRRHLMTSFLLDTGNHNAQDVHNILTNISKQAPNIKYGDNRNSHDIIRRIEGTRVYDTNDAKIRLEKNYKENLPNISDETKNAYKGMYEDLARYEMVESPLADLEYKNRESRMRLSNHYADLLNRNPQEAYSYLNWDRPINEIISMNDDKVLDILGNSKISYGALVNKRIKEVSPELLLEMQEGVAKSNKLYDSMIETNARVNAYLNIIQNRKIDIPTYEASSMFSNAKVEKNVIDNISDINEAIKRAGSKKKVSTNTEIIESASKTAKEFESFLKHDKMKTLAIAAAAIGITTAFLGYQYTASSNLLAPEVRPNGSGSPAPDGTYDDNGISIQHPHTAPPSSAIVSTNNGVKYDISGNGNVSDRNSLYNAIQHVIRKGNSDVSVTVNENDNTANISDNWIMNKVSKLIGR